MVIVELTGIAVAALLAENFILVNCLGIGDRVKSFHEPLDAWRTGFSLTIIMVLTALVTWVLDRILQPFALGYYQTLVFALSPLAMVGLLRWFLKNCVPELSQRMDDNLASIPFNCAAMGVALIISQRGYGLISALVYALFGGVGATLALLCYVGLRMDVSLNSCPKCFRGLPIKLITVGLMAMALMGFYGMHMP